MNADDLNSPIIARLESEILILRGALDLSRQRAEDAEVEEQNQRNRAESAEFERDALQAQIDQEQAKIDANRARAGASQPGEETARRRRAKTLRLPNPSP